jgi:hypothetical protein
MQMRQTLRTTVIAAGFLFGAACLKVSDGSNAGLLDFDAGPPRARPAPPCTADAGAAGPGSFRITISGGDFARTGYRFPPTDAGVPAFVDGWELSFNNVLVGISNIAVWEEPDRSPNDPTQVGYKVAESCGSWVVDLRCPQAGCRDGGISDGGTSDGGISDGGVIVEGPDPLAVEITNLIDQNIAGHRPFDPTKRYAVSFDIVVPDATARAVNVVNDSDVTQMRLRGYSVWYRGRANWRGSGPTCQSTDAGFNFATINMPLDFSLGLRTPATYFNCQNPLLPGPGIGGEPYPRGVVASSDARTTVQLTLRTDQTFSEDYRRADAPIHFDQFSAAAYSSFFGRSVQLEDAGYHRFTVGLNYTAFPVPWRWCSPELTGYQPPDNNPWMDFQGQAGRSYDPTLTQNLCSDAGYRDYYDLVSNIQSAQGYLNGPGRCALVRHFRCQPP